MFQRWYFVRSEHQFDRHHVRIDSIYLFRVISNIRIGISERSKSQLIQSSDNDNYDVEMVRPVGVLSKYAIGNRKTELNNFSCITCAALTTIPAHTQARHNKIAIAPSAREA